MLFLQRKEYLTETLLHLPKSTYKSEGRNNIFFSNLWQTKEVLFLTLFRNPITFKGTISDANGKTKRSESKQTKIK